VSAADAGASFDLYAPGASWLHAIDPRVKLLFVGLAMTLLLLWSNLPLIVIALVLLHLALWRAGFGGRRLATVWRALAPFLILIFVLWPIFNRAGTPVLLRAGPLIITGRALLAGLAAALRIAALSFVFVAWLGTTDQRALVRGFVRLGLPFSLGMSLTIGLRFIPTFAGLYQTVSEAQQSRGLVLGGRGLRQARAMIPILVAALVTALRMSEQLGWTLEARAFGAPVRRTTLRDLQMRPVDWLLLIAIAVVLGGLLGLTLAAGLGGDVLRPFG
jgi:energy-coupling factor transport system permease protein